MQLSAARQAYVPLKDLPVTVHTLCSGDSCLISKGLDGGGDSVMWNAKINHLYLQVFPKQSEN